MWTSEPQEEIPSLRQVGAMAISAEGKKASSWDYQPGTVEPRQGTKAETVGTRDTPVVTSRRRRGSRRPPPPPAPPPPRRGLPHLAPPEGPGPPAAVVAVRVGLLCLG